jgi:hypothetical protein
MEATYRNEYGDYEDCLLLSCACFGSTMVLIELDGERGYCSDHLVEVEEE